jgi:hypothetical protein
MTRRLQSVQPVTQARHDGDQVPDEPRNPHGFRFRTDRLLNSTSAASYLDFSSVEAFWVWAKRHGVRKFYRGRRLMFDVRDLDAAIGRRKVG